MSGNYEEFSYLLSFNHAVTDAIAEIWKSDEPLDTRVARSDWILRNLYVDLHILKLLDGSNPTATDVVSLTANRFALLISKLFSMPIGASSEERNREYVQWLVQRILARALREEAGLSATTADIIKRIFLDIAPPTIRSKRAKIIMALLHRYLRLIPESIQDALNRDPEFTSRLKLRFTMVVEIAGYRFERGPFLAAVRAAVNGRQGTVRELSSEATFKVHRASILGSNCSVFIEPEGLSEAHEVQEALFGALQDSPSAREEFLRAQSHLFDMPSADFARFVAEVASTEDPDRRMSRLEEERANSGSYYYHQLYQNLSHKEGFDRRDVLPHETILLRHYRVSSAPGKASVATVMTKAWQICSERNLW